MSSDSILDDVYQANGELNVSVILSNASLLLKSGEYFEAASLFRLIKNHPKFGFCGHYGLGQCFLKSKHPEQAAKAFEKALSLQRRHYIASALVESLLLCGEYVAAEKLTIGFAQEFVNDPAHLKLFRDQYQICVAKQKNNE